MSLSGWFHGKSAPRPERASLPFSPYLPSADLDEEKFYSWINPAYLDPETQEKMRAGPTCQTGSEFTKHKVA